jgi:hypothetical protein
MDPETQNVINQRIALQLGQLLIESISANAMVESLRAKVEELEKEKADGSRRRPPG